MRAEAATRRLAPMDSAIATSMGCQSRPGARVHLSRCETRMMFSVESLEDGSAKL